jgi:hypothetical protein
VKDMLDRTKNERRYDVLKERIIQIFKDDEEEWHDIIKEFFSLIFDYIRANLPEDLLREFLAEFMKQIVMNMRRKT